MTILLIFAFTLLLAVLIHLALYIRITGITKQAINKFHNIIIKGN